MEKVGYFHTHVFIPSSYGILAFPGECWQRSGSARWVCPCRAYSPGGVGKCLGRKGPQNVSSCLLQEVRVGCIFLLHLYVISKFSILEQACVLLCLKIHCSRIGWHTIGCPCGNRTVGYALIQDPTHETVATMKVVSISITSQSFLVPLGYLSLSPLLTPTFRSTPNLLSVTRVWRAFLEFYMNWTVRSALCFVWLLSLNIIILRFIQVVALYQ